MGKATVIVQVKDMVVAAGEEPKVGEEEEDNPSSMVEEGTEEGIWPKAVVDMDKGKVHKDSKVALMAVSKILPGLADLSTYSYGLHKKKVLETIKVSCLAQKPWR